MTLLCVTGPKIQMPEFASTNSRREGEITLLKFETTVVSNFLGRGDPCTQWKKRYGASRLSGSFFANEVTRTHSAQRMHPLPILSPWFSFPRPTWGGVRVMDICAARMSGAPHILESRKFKILPT